MKPMLTISYITASLVSRTAAAHPGPHDATAWLHWLGFGDHLLPLLIAAALIAGWQWQRSRRLPVHRRRDR